MEKALAKRTIKITCSIVILSVIGLILSSLLPWISVDENDSVEETLHFNKAMMEKSDNNQIKNLAGELDLINIIFWLLIIFSLISIVGMIIHTTEKHPSLALVMLIIGLGKIILIIFIIVLQILFIKTVNDIDTISISSIFSPIKYAHFCLGFSFILSIYIIIYTKVVIVPLIGLIKNSEKQKRIPKSVKKKAKKQTVKMADTTAKKSTVKKEQENDLEKLPTIPITEKKREEMQNWLSGQVQNIEKPAVQEKSNEPKRIEELPEEPFMKEEVLQEQLEPIIKEEAKEEIIEENISMPEEKKTEEQNIEEKPSELPILEVEEKEQIEEPKESPPLKSFEQALSSAIEKKQKENKEVELAEVEVNEHENKEPLNEPQQEIKEEETANDTETIDGVEEKSLPNLPVVTEKSEPELQVNKTTDEQVEDNKQEPAKESISIKCPQCSHIFAIEKSEEVVQIKCPKCGKEGSL